MHSVEDIEATDQSTGGVAAATPGPRRPGRRPRLTESEQEEVVRLYQEATTSTGEIRERFGIGDSSLYRLLQKHGVPLRGRAPSAASATAAGAAAATPAAGTSSAASSSRRASTRRSSRTRTAAPRSVKAPAAVATAPSTSTVSATPSTNGTSHAFSVSFRAVRIVEADSVLDVVRELERLGATDIEEISRQ